MINKKVLREGYLTVSLPGKLTRLEAVVAIGVPGSTEDVCLVAAWNGHAFEILKLAIDGFSHREDGEAWLTNTLVN